jgi:hypothetical protein
MAQTLPLVGAFGGASINVLFTAHFNAVARYHFGLRYLERRWGEEAVRVIYQDAAAEKRRRRRPPLIDSPDYDYRSPGVIAFESGKPR